jgi:FkbM family methyltransferase
VVDIGACLGDHTETYAEMVGPDGKVHAFEPNPRAFECLSFNMRKRPNVFCYPVALGAKTGNANVIPDANLGATQMEHTKHGPVTVLTLDSISPFWARLDFIKIDAEGWEPEILLGATKTIQRFSPAILVELNRPVLAAQGKDANDLLRPLREMNYHVAPCEPVLKMESPMLDLLCLPCTRRPSH